MKKTGVVLMIVGLVLFVGSCVLFVSIPIKSAMANKVIAVPLTVGQRITTDVLNVNTARLCSLAVEVTVESNKVYTRSERDRQTNKRTQEHVLQYRFPLSYEVLDASGNVLHSEATQIAWDSMILKGGDSTVSSRKGGSVEITHNYSKFKVDDPSGRVRIEVQVAPDTEYGAIMSSAQLLVYDNVSKYSRALLCALATLALAPLCLLAGTVFLVSASTSAQPMIHLGQSTFVRQVRVVGIFLIIQWALEALSALPFLLLGAMGLAMMSYMMSSLRETLPGSDDGGPFWAMSIQSMPVLLGLVLLMAGALKIWAGIRNTKYRGRVLGCVALLSGVVTLVICSPAPTWIALVVYALIIYSNRDVAHSFRLGGMGYTTEQIYQAEPAKSKQS